MGTTTPHSFPYPEATDLAAGGASAIQALAEAVDDALVASDAKDIYLTSGIIIPSGQFAANSTIAFGFDLGVVPLVFIEHFSASAIAAPALAELFINQVFGTGVNVGAMTRDRTNVGSDLTIPFALHLHVV